MKKTRAKTKKKRPHIPREVLHARSLLPVRKNARKWIVDASRFTPDMPEWGDYDTYEEAADDRNGVIRTRGAAEVLAICEQNKSQRSESTRSPVTADL